MATLPPPCLSSRRQSEPTINMAADETVVQTSESGRFCACPRLCILYLGLQLRRTAQRPARFQTRLVGRLAADWVVWLHFSTQWQVWCVGLQRASETSRG